ncbi:substrate-binding periplasmic protein [Chitinimonas naiadis]
MFSQPATNKLYTLFLASSLSVAMPLQAADLTAYTEEWPPYNFSLNGQVKGIATELLYATCEAAKLDCAFNIVPWARAYATAQAVPNTLVYTTARKPAREKEFIWLGPILPRTTWVFGRRGMDGTIHDFKDLSKHKIGVVRGEAASQDLQNAGVPGNVLMPEKSNADVLKLLSGGMVDAVVDTEIGMAWNLRNANLPDSNVVKLLKLTDEGAYYFALNLKSDPALVAKLQKALETLRSNGKIEALIRQYTQGSSKTP